MLSSTTSCSGVLRRAFATEATTGFNANQLTRPKRSQCPHISTAVILNRAPILTRSPTLFEQAYYAYQARIRRAISNPFPHEFYFKQGSLLETRFNMEERKRERLAFGPAFLPKEHISEETRAANEAAVEQLAQQEGEGEELMPRTHRADENNDVQSLDRRGKRNLYLLLNAVENGKYFWRFPQGGVEKGQLLHQAAQTDLYAECGDHMDSWVVGRNPIGVYQPPGLSESPAAEVPERYVFFFKAHIMAGQVIPDGKNIKDFAWLTKEEIEPRVAKHYWDGIKDILSDY